MFSDPKELIKEAVRTLRGMPGQEGKFIQRGSSEDVAAAFQSAGPTRKGKKKLYRKDRKLPRLQQVRPKHFAEAFKARAKGVVGTVVETREGKRRVLLNQDLMGKLKAGELPTTRRQVIAHEAFHAKAPKVLGNSETLAHLYGGFKGTKGSKAKKLKAALQQYNHYSNTRPHRSARAPLIGGAALGAGGGAVHALLKNRAIDKRKERQGEAFDESDPKNQKRSVGIDTLRGAAGGAASGLLLHGLSGAAGMMAEHKKRKQRR